MRLFDGLKSRKTVRSMSTEDAVDAVVVEARAEPAQPICVVARTSPASAADFDEFSAPEGAFGRFSFDLQAAAVEQDEHTRFVC